jgi:hypothetical protein
MLPFIPLVLSLAPQVAKWIFGDSGAAVSKDVVAAIQTVTGVDPTTQEGVAAAQAVIAGKPELALQLHQRLAEIAAAREAEANREADARRQSELDELKARIADIGNARQQTITLAQGRNPLAFGAPVLSGIILVAFAAMLLVILNRQLPEGSAPLANIMLGTLAAMATQVANYWLGSSSGSAAKNGMLAEAQAALATSTPMSPAGPAVPPAAPPAGPGAMPPRPTAPFTGAAGPFSADELNARSLAAARAG